MNKIVLFDGECHFCDQSVQFIIKRDPNANFKFASIQSDIGRQIIRDYNIPLHIDSLILIQDNQFYIKSTAALRICKNLKGVWKIGVFFLLIPTPIRDLVYDDIAKNRYKWFGKKEVCEIPSPEIKKRFL
ncbi:thiol-disulfide oxidoreductase DCC family protein [Mesobacillus maritimus]|uniref:Thiol-disulfide oxidoreductase DCC family protein n=1 Tax=Mesobacillus maritimus TaxID=1643336 RepID=A0ABS7K032_9BACI|nr:thiol-disulfide oxidoreductase DCC family protein [Mesobacillus maritimus]MBY0095564.1 thiol-disulfide oxidoreductase DCC family protein [Mesobacillus maritimus]